MALRICHLTAPSAFGGAEYVIAALAAGMARRGHAITVISLLDESGSSPFERLSGTGPELVTIRVPPRRYRLELRHLGIELSRIRPLLIHTHGYHADLVGLRAARQAGVPALSTVHGYTRGDWKNRLYEWLDRRALRRFDAVVPVSEPLRQELAAASVPAAKLRVMVNACVGPVSLLGRAESRWQLGLPTDALVAGWIGRIAPEKGPDVFLDALAQAPAWHGSLIGAGPLQDSLRSRAEALGVADRLHWHGSIPDASSRFDAFDVIVLSSRTEGTPIVLLEAMAAGIPLIATRVGGIPDAVGTGEAYLVPPEDPLAIARCLEQIARNPEDAAQRAGAARNRLREEFSPEAWLDGYERLYRELAGGNR